MILRFTSVGLYASLLAACSFAQDVGEVNMKATIGSFKILSAGNNRAIGKIKMSFTGTLLLVDYQGTTPVFTGSIRKEYDNQKQKRSVYNGTGTVTLDGTFRAIQWFGRDVNCNWVGNGVCRLYGEFDKSGTTGTYQVTGDALRYWGIGGTTFSIPLPNFAKQKAPKIKRSGG